MWDRVLDHMERDGAVEERSRGNNSLSFFVSFSHETVRTPVL